MALRYALLGKVLVRKYAAGSQQKTKKLSTVHHVSLSTTYSTMGRHAQSNAEKHRIKISNQEEGLAYAMKLHKEDKEKDEKDRRSLRALCQEAEEEMKKMGKNVTISHITLMRQLDGGRSCQEANAENYGWLTAEEEEALVAYCLELAARGFPLTRSTLKHHANLVAQARLGDKFPETGVGKRWIDRFLNRHSEQLGTYWSSPLDSNRGRAVNENTHKSWCDLLKDTLEKYNIDEDCIWGADETGFQPGHGLKDRVIGAVKQKIQHEQGDGNKENITVLVAVCADGSSIPPTIIYKGQSFSTNWHKDNTLQAS